MPTHASYGSIVTSGIVEDAVQATLVAWLPEYLEELARQDASIPDETLPMIRSWHRTDRFRDALPEQHVPAGIIIAGDGASQVGGTGEFVAGVWPVTVGIIVESDDYETTRRLAGLYIAAARSVLVHKSRLGKDGWKASWVGENTALVEDTAARTMYGGVTVFEVSVPEVMKARGGPATPAVDPHDTPDALPEVALVQVATRRHGSDTPGHTLTVEPDEEP